MAPSVFFPLFFSFFFVGSFALERGRWLNFAMASRADNFEGFSRNTRTAYTSNRAHASAGFALISAGAVYGSFSGSGACRRRFFKWRIYLSRDKRLGEIRIVELRGWGAFLEVDEKLEVEREI